MTLIDMNDDGDEIILEDAHTIRMQPSRINILDQSANSSALKTLDYKQLRNGL